MPQASKVIGKEVCFPIDMLEVYYRDFSFNGGLLNWVSSSVIYARY
ncbi:hypothetical protein LINPERHAP1_LOCUS27488 [Linum perenne]